VAPGLDQIDWQVPWLAPVAALGQQVAARCAAGWPLPEALNACATPAGDGPVRFVPQSELPPGEAYESYIFHSKQCPTREGLHDFFNGLMWHRFPRTKARLNQLQAAQITADGVGQVRGPVRDALTLFDENVAFLRAPAPLWEALMAKRWPVVFAELRPLWAQTHLVLFGHALLEKLVLPRKAITAHVLLVHPATDALVDLDAWVAAALSPAQLAAKPFANLPVLGVPGWWPANEAPGFYQDPTVFRRQQ
jgi:hypothetical protein